MSVAIAAVGAFAIFAIMWIERRTVNYLLGTMRRGTELEFSFGVTNGFFSRLTPEFFSPKGIRKFARRVDGLMVVYLIILAFWIYLASLSAINEH